MRYRATPDFWYHYRQLPGDVQILADRCYELLKQDSRYPSLHFKKVGSFWSVRIGLHYRALAVEDDNEIEESYPESAPPELVEQIQNTPPAQRKRLVQKITKLGFTRIRFP